MQYRSLFTQPETKFPILGMSCLRLPRRDDNTPDEEAVSALVAAAIGAGITLFDTGMSSRDTGLEALGRALAAFPRDGYQLMVSIPVADIRRPEDFDKFFEERLRRLGVSTIDLFALHVPSKDMWEKGVVRNGLLKRLNQLKKAGKVKAVGFSLHDDAAVFRRVLTGFEGWDFCRAAVNYVGAGRSPINSECLNAAADRHVTVMATEPVPGQKSAMPARVAAMLPDDRSADEWALDWLWNRAEIGSAMILAEPDEMAGFAAMADRAKVGMVSEEENQTLLEAGEIFRRAPMVDCTGCNYCVPCLMGLPIPRIYEAYNRSAADMRAAKRMYAELDITAADCLGCGACTRICPQKLDGVQLMPKIAALLGNRE